MKTINILTCDDVLAETLSEIILELAPVASVGSSYDVVIGECAEPAFRVWIDVGQEAEPSAYDYRIIGPSSDQEDPRWIRAVAAPMITHWLASIGINYTPEIDHSVQDADLWLTDSNDPSPDNEPA